MWMSLSLKKSGVEAEVLGPAADVAQGGLGRLLHDAPQRAGENQLLMPAHAGGFHEDDLAAELGPDEPGGHAHLVAGLGHFMGELAGAQELLHQGPRPR